MTSSPALTIATPTGVMAVNNWLYTLLHAAAAMGFIFLLQRFVLNATLESSLLWAAVFGGCAAILATMQANR